VTDFKAFMFNSLYNWMDDISMFNCSKAQGKHKSAFPFSKKKKKKKKKCLPMKKMSPFIRWGESWYAFSLRLMAHRKRAYVKFYFKLRNPSCFSESFTSKANRNCSWFKVHFEVV
jgi:hypothetical protein